MDDLAKVFAEVIEFIVGGVLFLASIAVLVAALSPVEADTLGDRLSDAPAGVGGLVTVAGLAAVYAMGIVAEGVSRLLLEWRLDQLTREKYPAPSTEQAIARREEQRLRAEATNPEYKTNIQTQLKRLRIERTLLLSSAVAAVGVAVLGHWLLVLFLGILTLMSAKLVDERFQRYLGAIDRCYRLSRDGDATREATG